MIKHFNRSHCTGCIRGEGRDIFGHKVIISGIHAFEYTVIIITSSTSETIRRFPNGREARRYFSAVTRHY